MLCDVAGVRHPQHTAWETALHVSGGTITLYQESKQLSLQYLVFITQFPCCVMWLAYATHSTQHGNCSTCFGWYHHPLSEEQTTVSTVSGIYHTVSMPCDVVGVRHPQHTAWETALHVSGGTITLYQESKQLSLQHLVFITQFPCCVMWLAYATHSTQHGNCSTCFGWYHHPLSGEQTTVSTASGIYYTVSMLYDVSGVRHPQHTAWKLLYMFRVVPSPFIRRANNCLYSIWYLLHSFYAV